MRTLTEADVVAAFREEHAKRLAELSKDVDVMFKTKNGQQQNVLSPGLKLKHRKSGLLYTIDSVGSRDAILKAPEGDKFLVNAPDLERDYQLD